MTVRVTNIQHFSLDDGPGIRTTVFLKGCNLTCPWCCNPENISFEIENYIHNSQKESFGYDISLEELEKEILKDEVFYVENNGGVTFSGGEPLLQIRELKPLLKSLRSKNINICFETSLSASSDLLKIAIEYIDEIFIDMKILDKKEAKNVLNLDLDLYYSIPTSHNGEELKGASNIWSDCFCMPNNDSKYASEEEALRHYKLGEEFIKFMSTPEMAVQNCYCVGYTPAVGGNDMLDYMRSCYDVPTIKADLEDYKVELEDAILNETNSKTKSKLQDELDEVISSLKEYDEIINTGDFCDYSLNYFYGDCGGDEIIHPSNDMAMRELKAQYPSEDELDRLAIMNDFGTEGTMRVLDMWEQVRTNSLPVWAIIVIILEAFAGISLGAYLITKKIQRKKLKKARY